MMGQVTDHLREVAVRDYEVDATEAQSMNAEQLAQAVLRGIAVQKYSADAASLEGKDTPQLIDVLLTDMVVDLLKVDPAKVTPQATFSDDLGADSLDMVELLMSIEETFEPFGGLKIEDKAAEEITTVQAAETQINNYIQAYLNQDAVVS